MTGRVLGTVSDAREALGLTDAADVWERVAAGQLVATRDGVDGPWTISEAAQ